MRLYKLNDLGIDFLGNGYNSSDLWKVESVYVDRAEVGYLYGEDEDFSDCDVYRVALKNIATGKVVKDLFLEEIEAV